MMKGRILYLLVAFLSLAFLTSACQTVVDATKEEANKEVIRRFVREGKNRENPAVFGEVFSPDYQHHFKIPGEELPPGLAGSGSFFHLLLYQRPRIAVKIRFHYSR
ncbi:MAG: hypothetical protein AAF629_08535, partial [Chloroflexota bacterium]